MDAKTFDRWTASLTRLLTEAGSRRRALTFGAIGLAGLWHLGNADEMAAKRKHRKHKKRKKNKTSPPPLTDTCANGVKDPGETDVDCGGGTCKRCGIGKVCTSKNDCESAFCSSGACQACVSNIIDCGLDIDGTQCACRPSVAGPSVCTKSLCVFHMGGTCALCAAGEQCTTAGGGIECCHPCGTP